MVFLWQILDQCSIAGWFLVCSFVVEKCISLWDFLFSLRWDSYRTNHLLFQLCIIPPCFSRYPSLIIVNSFFKDDIKILERKFCQQNAKPKRALQNPRKTKMSFFNLWNIFSHNHCAQTTASWENPSVSFSFFFPGSTHTEHICLGFSSLWPLLTFIRLWFADHSRWAHCNCTGGHLLTQTICKRYTARVWRRNI